MPISAPGGFASAKFPLAESYESRLPKPATSELAFAVSISIGPAAIRKGNTGSLSGCRIQDRRRNSYLTRNMQRHGIHEVYVGRVRTDRQSGPVWRKAKSHGSGHSHCPDVVAIYRRVGLDLVHGRIAEEEL